MTILYPPQRPVKPSRPFGRGLLAYVPCYRVDHSVADADWLAAQNAIAEPPFVDRSGEFEVIGKLSAGLPLF